MINCPECDREWPKSSEQGVSINLYDECVVCKFTPLGKGSNNGTNEEFEAVIVKALELKSTKV